MPEGISESADLSTGQGAEGMTSFMQRIRNAVFGRGNPGNASEAFRNVGQLEWTGTLAPPIATPEPGLESEARDSRETPWELRD